MNYDVILLGGGPAGYLAAERLGAPGAGASCWSSAGNWAAPA